MSTLRQAGGTGHGGRMLAGAGAGAGAAAASRLGHQGNCKRQLQRARTNRPYTGHWLGPTTTHPAPVTQPRGQAGGQTGIATHDSQTALTGVLVRGFSRCHQRWPGTAPSREKAYSMLPRGECEVIGILVRSAAGAGST